ncbi:MAG: iron ABC transporter permease [Planctomycetota bacterium]|nr:MAG: iron ABC transporter permease [Planctomycetota bacterium]
MSRTLVLFALAVLFVAGLAPVLLMFARLSPGDLATLLDGRTLALLGRTVLLGVGVVFIAVLVGVPFGFLTSRTDVPGSAILRPLGVVPLVLPPLFLAMTFTSFLDVSGAAMTILVLGVGTFPIVALFAGRAWRRIDARREEAAYLVGGLPAVLRMELPLVLPAVLCGACLAFVFAVNDFSVPDFVGFVGQKFNVYADEIFATWQIDRIDEREGRAVATSLPLVGLTLLSLLPALALRRKGALATVGSDFQRPAPLALGRWRLPAFLFCLTVVAATTAAPLGRLAWEAGGGAQGFSLATMQRAFATTLDQSRDQLGASILYAVAAATICVPVALVLGHAAERARYGRFLEWIAILPIAVPAILFGIGNIVLWNHPLTSSFFRGGGLVVLMFVGRFLAYPFLVSSGAVASLDRELEEAGELAGAGPIARLGRIVAPSLWPSLVGGWTLVFVLAMRELDATILVSAANGTAMFRIFNQVHFGRDDFVAALALLIVFVAVLPGLLWTLFGGRKLEVLP